MCDVHSLESITEALWNLDMRLCLNESDRKDDKWTKYKNRYTNLYFQYYDFIRLAISSFGFWGKSIDETFAHFVPDLVKVAPENLKAGVVRVVENTWPFYRDLRSLLRSGFLKANKDLPSPKKADEIFGVLVTTESEAEEFLSLHQKMLQSTARLYGPIYKKLLQQTRDTEKAVLASLRKFNKYTPPEKDVSDVKLVKSKFRYQLDILNGLLGAFDPNRNIIDLYTPRMNMYNEDTPVNVSTMYDNNDDYNWDANMDPPKMSNRIPLYPPNAVVEPFVLPVQPASKTSRGSGYAGPPVGAVPPLEGAEAARIRGAKKNTSPYSRQFDY